MTSSSFDLKRGEAHAAIRHIGTNGIPVLLRLLRVHDSAARRLLVAWAPRASLLRIGLTPAFVWNNLAGNALADLGPEGVDAIPSLIEIYESNFSSCSQVSCLHALAHIDAPGEQTRRLLLRARNNTNVFVRAYASGQLRHMGPQP